LNGLPSSEHWKVEFACEEVNLKVGVRSVVWPDGPLLIVVSGGVVSTVNEREAGVASVFPAESVARTWKV
jgi:hypothetical protein